MKGALLVVLALVPCECECALVPPAFPFPPIPPIPPNEPESPLATPVRRWSEASPSRRDSLSAADNVEWVVTDNVGWVVTDNVEWVVTDNVG